MFVSRRNEAKANGNIQVQAEWNFCRQVSALKPANKIMHQLDMTAQLGSKCSIRTSSWLKIKKSKPSQIHGWIRQNQLNDRWEANPATRQIKPRQSATSKASR